MILTKNNFKFTGLIIYILGVTLLFYFKNYFNSYPFYYKSLPVLALLINPLIIYVYDYLFNNKYLSNKINIYHILIFLCCLFEIIAWNQFRFGDLNYIFFTIILISSFIIQFIISYLLQKNHVCKFYAVPILLILPLLVYGWYSFAISILLGFIH